MERCASRSIGGACQACRGRRRTIALPRNMSQTASVEPSRSAPRRRRPWLAGFLSLLWLGVGQLYNGEARKAAALYAIWLAVGSTVILLTIVTTPTPVTVAAVLLSGVLAA